MKIDPSPLAKTRPDAGQVPRTGETVSGSSERPGRRGSEPPDQIELSESGRALQGRVEGAAASRSLGPARLQEILDRIHSGHYDRAEVQDEVVRRMAVDLELR